MIKIFFQQPTGFLFEITEQEFSAIKKKSTAVRNIGCTVVFKQQNIWFFPISM